jgi:spore germination protein GerM
VRTWLVALALAALLAIGGGLWYALQREEIATVDPVIHSVPGTRAIDLFLPDANGKITRETRDILGSDHVEEDMRRAVEELIAGGRSGARVIPASTRLLNVFADGTGGVTLNFSEDLRAHHPGGSSAEIATLRCLVSTVGSNFPGVDQVQILIDGEIVPTLAGHVNLQRPLRVADYR